MSLPTLPIALNTSDNNIALEFYEPCLHWASHYDRGVGYFTSGWLRENATGMTSFASQGGKARWITSPHLEGNDLRMFQEVAEAALDATLVSLLRSNLKELQKTLEGDTLNALAWMIYDEIIEFKFAVPQGSLEGGDFHDKFGIFRDDEGNVVSFNGSQNDSIKGTVNYESIKVFPSWVGLTAFADYDQRRFERLWGGLDPNVKVHSLPNAIREEILKLRTDDRPYSLPKPATNTNNSKWRHQDEAVEAFIAAEHGVLEMATGTGKTRTALRIADELLRQGKIDSVLVSTYGTDLLDQWRNEILGRTNLPVFRYYSAHKELSKFLLDYQGSVLIASRSAEVLGEVVRFTPPRMASRALVIFDEVHGMGSPSLVASLSGKLNKFRYRLGLSATPEREYDEDGNVFIQNEIGDVIYRFGLEDAIRRGILCEFGYSPLPFDLTQEDRKQIQKLIATYNTRKKEGQPVKDTDLYRDLANVRKLSVAKIPIFKDLVKADPSVLERTIIFVATKEYGELVQQILIHHLPAYHTYFAEDDRENLVRFAQGDLSCLITSHRISEGIDIRSLNNVILLASDRAKLESIQRIGRCLRTDPDNPQKRARVIDFVQSPSEGDLRENADQERAAWLTELSQVKREA